MMDRLDIIQTFLRELQQDLTQTCSQYVRVETESAKILGDQVLEFTVRRNGDAHVLHATVNSLRGIRSQIQRVRRHFKQGRGRREIVDDV